MASSQELFNKLFEEDHIRLERTAFFDRMPSRLPPSFNFDRIEGMLLGLAVGDSLGKTSESMTPSERRARFGEIKDYRPHPAVNNQPIGLPSDDTQLAYWMLECLLKDGGFDPDSVANAFSQERIYGVGSTMRGFLRNYKLGSKPWYECGPHSAGNGALMRIAPIVIPHLRKPSPALWSDTALCAMTTHNDPTSTSSCLAFVSMIWQLLGMKETPEPTWWLKTYIEVARELEGDPALEPRGGTHTDYVGSLCNYLDWVVPEAYEKDLSTREACDGCYSGAFLMETVPCVLYILMRHGDDFEEALIRAVNDTRDNDTVAAIVGAVLGALHGKQAIPERWLKGLSGRTRENDDGHVFELIEQSRRIFWEDEDGFDRVRSEGIGTSDHIEKVSKWVDQNVRTYHAQKKIILCDFDVDWEDMTGSFQVIFDDEACSDRFKFSYKIHGRVGYSMPMFVSPLGAPASYSAIELNREADVAICRGLGQVLPEIKAFGFDKETDTLIVSRTPFEQRLPPLEIMEGFKSQFIDPLFSVEIEVNIPT
jgi:ADP-ribosyl-[dinitrogen reductase] hydrolase